MARVKTAKEQENRSSRRTDRQGKVEGTIIEIKRKEQKKKIYIIERESERKKYYRKREEKK